MGQSAQSTRQPFLARLRRFASPFPSTVATPAPPSPNSTEGLPCLMPDTETSANEEPGARKGHAGICAGAAWATSRPTAIELVRFKVRHSGHQTLEGHVTFDIFKPYF